MAHTKMFPFGNNMPVNGQIKSFIPEREQYKRFKAETGGNVPFGNKLSTNRPWVTLALSANVLLPEPETPISTTRESSGMVIFIGGSAAKIPIPVRHATQAFPSML